MSGLVREDSMTPLILEERDRNDTVYHPFLLDKDLPTIPQVGTIQKSSLDFPEGGLRAWSAVIGRRALVTGIATAGTAVGGILQSIGLNHLINGLLVIANLIMRPGLPPRRQRADKPPKPNIQAIFRDNAYLTATLSYEFASFKKWITNLIPILELDLYTGDSSFLSLLIVFYVQLFAVIKGVSPGFAFYSVYDELAHYS
ncbi:hypothetical protein Clacol_001848 [Clathrus columnatus]|uniref:Uncharacterized protein n=1 Tax=Clathrus columnatus TaxID=1419009 RepID=A0AAV5A4G0_9AGAM|nr:hypothetical protein Clacol_001848 [Clathrus columnatus]